MSDQPVAETATYTTHNEHRTTTYIPSVGFEHLIPAIEGPQTCVFDSTVTTIGLIRSLASRILLQITRFLRNVLSENPVI